MISIILPVFNAENSLKKTIDSIINQDIGFENIELIIVDDKSTDNSKEIIKKYANKHDNIKPTYLTENSGSPVKPRNTGIEKVNATYLMFIDSDDFLLKDCCSTVYNIALKEDSDLVHFTYLRFFDDNFWVYNHINNKNTEYYKINNISDKIMKRGTVWGNLFKTSLIKENNIYFKDVLHEDGTFSLEAYIKAKKLIELPNFYGYIYNIDNDNSLTHKIKEDSLYNYLEGFKESVNVLKDDNLDEYISMMSSNLIPMFYFMFFKYKGDKKDKMNILKNLQKFQKNLNCEIKLRSKPIDYLNNLVLKEKYSQAMIISNIASKVYTNSTIKNLIFKKYSGIKKIEL